MKTKQLIIESEHTINCAEHTWDKRIKFNAYMPAKLYLTQSVTVWDEIS